MCSQINYDDYDFPYDGKKRPTQVPNPDIIEDDEDDERRDK